MGEAMAKAFMAVRHYEWKELKDMDLNEEVALLAERY